MNAGRRRFGIDRVLRHEKMFAWPLFVASLAWFSCITAVWVDQHPSAIVRYWCAVILAVTWCWFIVDFLWRLVLSGHDRVTFMRTRIFDLITITVPFLRPFMIMPFIWRLPVFKRGSAALLRVRYGIMTMTLSFLLVYVGAYLVWATEKDHQGALITSFGDAMWWGFATITTVGYGDLVPITVPGRVLAVFLMVGGVFVVGVTTATVVSALSDHLKQFVMREASEDASAAALTEGEATKNT